MKYTVVSLLAAVFTFATTNLQAQITTQTSPRILDVDQLSAWMNGHWIVPQKNQVEINDNTVVIYANDQDKSKPPIKYIFQAQGADGESLKDLMSKYNDRNYPAPQIGCDSLSKLCKKNKAFNIFWGDIYSVSKGKGETKTVSGVTREKQTQSSLLITRGWEIDCCTGEFSLRLFFQAMEGSGTLGSANISFSVKLKFGYDCPNVCPECKKKCDELKRQMQGRQRN